MNTMSPADSNAHDILLSVCIPTYNRLDLLERAIRSVMAEPEHAHRIEIIVSDNSDNDKSKILVESLLNDWQGQWSYIHNDPPLYMVDNFNRSLKEGVGTYLMSLHDDDYLLPGALGKALSYLEDNQDKQVHLFGLNVVNSEEGLIKRQTFNKTQYLKPEDALWELISNSSFVRVPGIIMKREAWREFGFFRAEARNQCDLDLWLAAFSKYGVNCSKVVMSAYTVHTSSMTNLETFTAENVDNLMGLFSRADTSLLGDKRLSEGKALFFHKFIFAGLYRQLRWGNWGRAVKVAQLFDHDPIRQLAIPKRWSVPRQVLRILLGFNRGLSPALVPIMEPTRNSFFNKD